MEIVENIKTNYIHLVYNMFGNVRRARGYYLYTDKKKRILDMYLLGGRAILGHRPKGVLTRYKRELSKALFGIFPTKARCELKKALHVMFPGYSSIICATEEKARNIAKDVPIYRPFLQKDWDEAFLFLPYPSFQTTIILYKDNRTIRHCNDDVLFSGEENAISAFIYELIRQIKKGENASASSSLRSKKTLKKEREIEKEREYTLSLLSNFFEMNVPYLFFKKNRQISYQDFFISALKADILLPPSEEEPSIFPKIKSYKPLISFLKSII